MKEEAEEEEEKERTSKLNATWYRYICGAGGSGLQHGTDIYAGRGFLAVASKLGTLQ